MVRSILGFWQIYKIKPDRCYFTRSFSASAFEEYRNNGTLAVLMFKEDGELYGCITVNLNHPLQSDTLAFLDENNMPGIGRWLRKKKLGIDMGVKATSGFCTYPLYMLF